MHGLDQFGWVLVVVVIAWTVLQCLKVFAIELESAARIHQLRVDARRLRNEQMRRIKSMYGQSPVQFAEPAMTTDEVATEPEMARAA